GTRSMNDTPREQDARQATPTGAGDTRPLPSDDTSTLRDAEQALQEAAPEGTNVDTLVGRLVIEQGLATEDEVGKALDHVKVAREKQSDLSLAEVLVDADFVTKRQIARLRQIIEAQRSGQKIPGYKILGKLGAGAMATVYKAKQLSLDRMVAIKVLPPKFANNPQFIERFYAEGRAAAQLNHPNIVQAFDVGRAGDLYFFIMEYVDGRTVYDDIIKHKRYLEGEALDIIIQIAEALEHAHSKGLIHRDVKPKNVMIAREGVAKLADMGLARAITDKEAAEAEAGKAFGTPYYISPEQIRGEKDVGPPADIYSLGATLYHMVTGTVPFDGKNPSAVMHKHLKAELVPPDHVNPKLNAGISEVIEMMMAKNPAKRYRTCADLLLDLRQVRKGETPTLAHKDVLPEAAIASLAAAEAQAAPTMEMPEDRSGGNNQSIRPWLFRTLCVVAIVSILLNIVLLAT
ncbi:Serine/threonine protein kinase PrkC, regulator of stationary phase, partial [hydrothermal vent metagenome]